MRTLFALLFALIIGAAQAQVTPGTSPLTIAKGGTAGATAAAARTNLGVPTGTSGATLGFLNTANTWSATQTFPNNSLTLAEFPAIGANTLLGSAAGGTPSALTIGGLTNKPSPATTDILLLQDQAASGALKYCTLAQCIGATASGVSSIAGNTGAFTLGAGLTNNVNQLSADPTYLRGYISGLTLSNDGVTPNTILDIAAGVATDVSQLSLMSLASAYTKTTGTWAVGTGNGALDTGSIGAASWYHVFLIQRSDTGVVDILFSLSPTSPTMPTSYNRKRRIGSFKTSGSNIVAFTQFGNKFFWSAPVMDANGAAVGITRVVQTVTVPTGVAVEALAVIYGSNASPASIWFGPLFVTDAAPSSTASPGASMFTGVSTTSIVSGGAVSIPTNTSAQIGIRSSIAGSAVTIFTNGWVDNL